MEWISVEKMLPGYDAKNGARAYWIAKKRNNGEWEMRIALYSDYGYAMSTDATTDITWRDYDFCKIINVTHWMPLPEPPKEEKRE